MIINLHLVFAAKTKRMRHWLVKLLAPTLYKGANPFPRGMVKNLKTKFQNKSLTGVEIGVYEGRHAESILETLNIERLYLVDPYKTYEGFSCIAENVLHEAVCVAKHRLAPYRTKIKWIKKTSEEATLEVPDELDFVYIDGNHSYEFVKEDIELYYPKIKEGGMLGGDNFEVAWNGVVKAVIEFTTKEKIKLFVEKPSDWYILKTGDSLAI